MTTAPAGPQQEQKEQKEQKLWGGRFAEATDHNVEAFSASIADDGRMFAQDIRASIVHCRMLARQGILAPEESTAIIAGLRQVWQEIGHGTLQLRIDLEDIHMNVESRLREIIGPVAGKLHTARSRNDQVATDVRLYLREQTDRLLRLLRSARLALLDLADRHVDVIMPGFTHMQIAQPVSFAHHLLAYVEMLWRDGGRFADARKRLNMLPLGSAALAGTSFPVDRHWVARELGFDGVCSNSMDAVSDRDFAVELASAAAMTMVHLSRLSEDIILWISSPFAFIDLPDRFCTGSSIMPQKKNPDVSELVRGKTGRVIGDVVALLTLMKGLPMTYNRDMQEDKPAIFDAMDTLESSLSLYSAMIPGIRVRAERMREMAQQGYSTATDLADALVGRGIPFREAHEIVGHLVRIGVESGRELSRIPLEEMQAVDPRIDAAMSQVLTVEASVNSRKAFGGTACDTVRAAIAAALQRDGEHDGGAPA
jgi:argininosuccinate lyase